MELTKEKRKQYGMLHMINPSELNGFYEHVEWLEAILHNQCAVWEENGDEFLIEIRQLIQKVNGLKIEIYPNEHAPPHFHVKSPNINASFTIENCEKLEGNINSNDLKKIKFWHKSSKQLLISKWNETRPTDCTVGEYENT